MLATTCPGRQLILGVLALPVLYACGSEGAGPETDPDPTASVRVTVSTAGASVDGDGYVVRLGARSRNVQANGSVVFEDLEPGVHTVELSDLEARCAVEGGQSTEVVAAAGSVAEVTFRVECGLFAQVTCPAFELESSTGLPLDEIAIGTLPASFDFPVAASIAVDGTAQAGLAYVRTTEAGEAVDPRLVVPLHPVSPFDGGVIQLTVSDGEEACPPVEFDIEPLPAAEGEFEAVVDLLQDVLDEQASHLGTTRDVLVATPVQELPGELWPLAMAQFVLDDPANEQSLRAAAEGALGADVKDWLDRLVARTEVRSSLEASLQGGPGHGPGPSRQVSDLQCTVEFVNGSEGSVLEGCMSAAAEARAAASGISKKVSEDIGTALSALGDFADFYGIPLVDVVDALFSAFFWVIYNEREKTAAVYPSSFTSMDLDVDRLQFAEDEDAEGRVTRVEVTATNEGYDLQEVLLDALKEGFSLAQTTGKFDFSTWEPIDKAFDAFKPFIEQRLSELEIEDLQLPVEIFGPVDITDPQLIQARVATGEAIEMVGDLRYAPRLWGPATLSVRTFDGKFGGQQIARQKEIDVPAIQLSITPDDTVVEASESGAPKPVTLELEVLRSVSPDSVELDQEHPAQGTATLTVNEGSKTHEIIYTPPAEPDFDASDLVAVRHTARAGARENGPPRTATAQIRFGSITISPRSVCLAPGETQPFTAEVEGLDDETVVWSADVGDIDEATGLYTADPDAEPGSTATITARSASDPDLTDQVTIQIGPCICRHDVTLSGGMAGISGGPAGFGRNDGGLQLDLGSADEALNTGDPIFLGVDLESWNGEPGTYSITSASATHSDIGTAWYEPGVGGALDCPSCGGTLTIDSAEEESVAGSYQVTMPALGFEAPPVTAVGTFLAHVKLPGVPLDPYRECLFEYEEGG